MLREPIVIDWDGVNVPPEFRRLPPADTWSSPAIRSI